MEKQLKLKENKKLKRVEELINFEKKIIEENFYLIHNPKFQNVYVAGIDEVGRGALAGPVVVGAVILKNYQLLSADFQLFGIDDSKKISSKEREVISSKIKENCIGWSIGVANEKTIDEKNILQATYLAAKDALNKLYPKPHLVIADMGCIRDYTIPVISVKHGDALCVSIAAASIIAKVARDDIMKKEHLVYPEFNFLKNKGYGTQEHFLALKKYGTCPLHRIGFGSVREYSI